MNKDHYAETPRELALSLAAQILNFKELIKVLIKSLPDSASSLRPLPGSVRCGVVQSSTLSSNKNWSPSCYFSIENKKYFMSLIENSSMGSLVKKIQTILETEEIIYPNGHHETLNSDFLEALKGAWQGA